MIVIISSNKYHLSPVNGNKVDCNSFDIVPNLCIFKINKKYTNEILLCHAHPADTYLRDFLQFVSFFSILS